ncbi:sel1 repeat family protein [Vibrio genomosp. F6]|uniref:tetratricopeptide repeat protein n=1 Tax=Vibrio genomosp. F6 TaxID=723172 RepID=UPI0010BD5AAC|nr:tetratricopeptide repeat protein [Vibrio genomosp. F6]TKF21596.1 sel1 repeat family protein [Vibrio genomosp. F6]
MSTMGIAIGATLLSLVLVFVWLVSLSLRKQRIEQERKAREVAYRKAIEKAKQQEQQERVFKAETGHVPTILFLAKEAERGNLKEALYWYNKAAKLDNVSGMYGVVRISDRVKDDLILKEQANFWRLSIAAADGDKHAKYEAGKALIGGRGTDKNIPKGVSVIEEVADEGNVEAMLFMGDWSMSKENMNKSPVASSEWYQFAANKGNSNGRIKLGLNYLHGIGVEKSHTKGCYWLELAAEKGSYEAMYHAGEAWREHGANGNAIAYIWLFLSAHFGYEPARAARDVVGGIIDVETVVGLQTLSKPLMKKLTEGSAPKHSIIRALNKLYKREEFFPEKLSSEDVQPVDNVVVESDDVNKSAFDVSFDFLPNSDYSAEDKSQTH